MRITGVTQHKFGSQNMARGHTDFSPIFYPEEASATARIALFMERSAVDESIASFGITGAELRTPPKPLGLSQHHHDRAL